MQKSNKEEKKDWLFYPSYLTEIMGDLVPSMIQSGMSEKLKEPIDIVEFRDGKPEYIRPVNPVQNFKEFCKNFRSKEIGGDELCRKCVMDEALILMKSDKKIRSRCIKWKDNSRNDNDDNKSHR